MVYLQTNTSLKFLRLNGNKIGNRGGLCFAQALQVNVVLESLDLGDADLVSTLPMFTSYLYHSLSSMCILGPLMCICTYSVS